MHESERRKIEAPAAETASGENDWISQTLTGLSNGDVLRELLGEQPPRPGEQDDLRFGHGLPFGQSEELAPGQWRATDRAFRPTDPEASFWQASVENTRNRQADAYQTIGQRHDYYDFADSYLASERPELNCKWFGAARDVTGWNGLGAADGINAWFLSDETEDFMRQGNEFLFGHNMDNLARLAQDGQIPGMEGLSGKELDYALVNFEQNKLQEFMDNYEKQHGDISGITEQLSDNLGSVFAADGVKQAMAQFEEQGITFDFRNVDHRIALGRAMVDQAHAAPPPEGEATPDPEG